MCKIGHELLWELFSVQCSVHKLCSMNNDRPALPTMTIVSQYKSDSFSFVNNIRKAMYDPNLWWTHFSYSITFVSKAPDCTSLYSGFNSISPNQSFYQKIVQPHQKMDFKQIQHGNKYTSNALTSPTIISFECSPNAVRPAQCWLETYHKTWHSNLNLKSLLNTVKQYTSECSPSGSVFSAQWWLEAAGNWDSEPTIYSFYYLPLRSSFETLKHKHMEFESATR